MNIISIFATLCGSDMRPLLEAAVDRWKIEIMNEPAVPIIEDYDKACGSVSKLFELRHAICHEIRKLTGDEIAELPTLLQSLTSFVHALEEVLTKIAFGEVPLTQSAMNVAAGQRLTEADDKMNQVLAKLRERYQSEPRQLKLLKATQTAWKRYRKLQSLFRHDPIGGGTIGPMVRALEAEELTRERTERLRIFLEAPEGFV